MVYWFGASGFVISCFVVFIFSERGVSGAQWFCLFGCRVACVKLQHTSFMLMYFLLCAVNGLKSMLKELP